MPARNPLILLAAACALAACQRADEPKVAQAPAPPEGASELDWARTALGRNPDLEVLATDAAAGVFTVRDRGSGEVRTVKLSELAAAPVDDFGPVHVASALPPEAEPAPATEAEEVADGAEEPALDYKVERSGGQLRVSGPGVSIVSATAPAPQAAAADTGPRTVDPIICDGERVMQVNNRRVAVEGDAITARNGCQLHLINSRVTATGTGILIQDATVHVTNSTVEGGTASFDAGHGARIFLQGATLKGPTRRAEGAEVHEQGNNQWR